MAFQAKISDKILRNRLGFLYTLGCFLFERTELLYKMESFVAKVERQKRTR